MGPSNIRTEDLPGFEPIVRTRVIRWISRGREIGMELAIRFTMINRYLLPKNKL